MSRANAGDLVVLCVDKHPSVMAELETWSKQAQAGSGSVDVAAVGDPDLTPPTVPTERP
jgi:cyanophycin synthetase